jgi:hypothetical protein
MRIIADVRERRKRKDNAGWLEPFEQGHLLQVTIEERTALRITTMEAGAEEDAQGRERRKGREALERKRIKRQEQRRAAGKATAEDRRRQAEERQAEAARGA